MAPSPPNGLRLRLRRRAGTGALVPTGFGEGSSLDGGGGSPLRSLQPRAVAVPVIVILGGGFAGISVARRLEDLLRPGEAASC